METLRSLFPTADLLLGTSPEDLAPVLLKLARNRRSGSGMFWPQGITEEQRITGERGDGYPIHTLREIDALIRESWACLSRDGLIMPAPEENGRAGYMVLTRAGEEASKSSDAYERLRTPRRFQKHSYIPASQTRFGQS